jgi:magnesium-transporting ATPase (P-type)
MEKISKIKKIVTPILIASVQFVVCYLLWYVVVYMHPFKGDLAFGIGLYFWWYIQMVTAIVASFLLIFTAKKFWTFAVLSQIAIFVLWWGNSWLTHPYRVSFLFLLTLCGIIIGIILCKYFQRKLAINPIIKKALTSKTL